MSLSSKQSLPLDQALPPEFSKPEFSKLEISPAEGLGRRGWLASVSSVIALSGCPKTPDPKKTSVDRKASDVPLRVVWVGTESEADTLRRTWQSISEQPLDIRLASIPQFGDVSGAGEDSKTSTIAGLAAKADVVIYPLMWMAEMIDKQRLMPLLSASRNDKQDDVFMSNDRRSISPALRVATSFAGEQRSIPLGGHLPALLLTEAVDQGSESIEDKSDEPDIKTWTAYHDFAKKNDGKCGEPTAKGWAGSMYLWRLSTSLGATWLFDRKTLRPLLGDPEYISVLDQMAKTIRLNQSLYESDGLTPAQVFDSVATGKLAGGIGFPGSIANSQDQDNPVLLSPLPGHAPDQLSDEDSESVVDTELRRSMMNPFMLVGSLAASCRQTAAADQFLQWIAGGQGSEPIYRNVGSVINTNASTADDNTDATKDYSKWLQQQLNVPNVLPSLQLLGASEYYAVLDEGVRDCVHGDVPAAEACKKMAKAWTRLHRKFDLPRQQQTWRRAQGIA